MSLELGFVVPHNPVFIPALGDEDLKKAESSVYGLLQLADIIAEKNIDTVVVISPHAMTYADGVSFVLPKVLDTVSGDLESFGLPDTRFNYLCDRELTEKFISTLRDERNFVYQIEDADVDYATLVPLYYLTRKLPEVRIVSMGIGHMGGEKHYNIGKIMKRVCEESEKNICFVVSGELSHRLSEDSAAGYHPEGKEFDKKLIDFLEKGNFEGVPYFDPFWMDDVAQDIHKGLCVLLGILEGTEKRFKKLSYEHPFGVGFLTGYFS